MRPVIANTRLSLLVLSVAALGLAGNAWSEEVTLPGAAAESSVPAPVVTPARGALMNKVEAQFGAPTERHAAVGNPPITRWDYPGFSVFFEREHVIHSVVR